MMTRQAFLRVAMGLVAVSLAGTLVNPSGGDVPSQPRPPSDTPSGVSSVVPSASAPMSIHAQPTRYRTDVFTNDGMLAQRRGARAEGEWFVGTMNGIPVDWQHTRECRRNWVRMAPDQVKRYPLPAPGWLPSGTVQTRHAGWSCGSRPLFVERIFQVGRGDLTMAVVRSFGDRVLNARAGVNRVGPGRILGRPAVFVRPLSRAGGGNSYIAIRDGDDLVEFQALNIRFSDLRRMAESFPL